MRLTALYTTMARHTSPNILTIPNLLTLFRLLCVPVFLVELIGFGNNVVAFIFFALASITDFLDGYVARAFNQVSEFGKQFDPFVDRVLILAAVLSVLIVGRLPWWLFLILILRDASMLVVTWYMETRLRRHFSVVYVGKAATATLMVAICSLILDWPLVPGLAGATVPLGFWLACLGALLSWIAGVYYIVRAATLPPLRPAGRHTTSPSMGSASSTSKTSSSSGPAQTAARSAAELRSRGSMSARQDMSGSRSPRGERPTSRNRSSRTSEPVRSSRASRTSRQARPRRPLTVGNILWGGWPNRIVVMLVCAAILVVVGFFAVNGISNWGKVHRGVYVGNIYVGGMTLDQATQAVDQGLMAQAQANPVNLYQTAKLKAKGPKDDIDVLDTSVSDYDSDEVDTSIQEWQVSTDYLGVGVDGASLAQAAYAYGRGGDFWAGTWNLAWGTATVAPALTYNPDQMKVLYDVLTRSIGFYPVNYNLNYDTSLGAYQLIDGKVGTVADMAALQPLLDQAFLGSDRGIVVPMKQQDPDITAAVAQASAQTIQGLIAQPIALTYKTKQWSFSTATLGSWLSLAPAQNADGSWYLKASMGTDTLQKNLTYMVGSVLNTLDAPVNASFKVVGGIPYVQASKDGKGIDYNSLAQSIDTILYTPGAERSIALPVGVLKPDITTAEAKAMDISQVLGTYTTKYNSAAERITNVHVGADLIKGALVAPDGTFSFNKRTGKCTAAKGFKTAHMIQGGQYVDAIAGGLCQVATTLFNAVWVSGLPVVSRANHSIYQPNYPTGRDAAVSYPSLDFQFGNDTGHYVLVWMTYTNDSLTCTLYGQDPGYRVVSKKGDWTILKKFKTIEKDDPSLPTGTTKVQTKGMDAKKIQVERIVYDKDGKVLRDTVFNSRYKEVDEVDLIGTGPAAPSDDTSSSTSGSSGSSNGSGSDGSGSGSSGSNGRHGSASRSSDTLRASKSSSSDSFGGSISAR